MLISIVYLNLYIKCMYKILQKTSKIYQSILFKYWFYYKFWKFSILFYALFNSSLNLSAIIAINSEFVGFPFAADTV